MNRSTFKLNVHSSPRLSRFPVIYNDVDFSIFVKLLDLKTDGELLTAGCNSSSTFQKVLCHYGRLLSSTRNEEYIIIHPQLCATLGIKTFSTTQTAKLWIIHTQYSLSKVFKLIVTIFWRGIYTPCNPRDISWLQTIRASNCIIQEKETQPPIASFSASVYYSFAQKTLEWTVQPHKKSNLWMSTNKV